MIWSGCFSACALRDRLLVGHHVLLGVDEARQCASLDDSRLTASAAVRSILHFENEVPMKKLCAIAIVASAVMLGAQSRQQGLIEWPFVGADPSHTKYSIAADITPANVNQLDPAWQWEAKEKPMPEYGARPGTFENTPLMVDNVLYVSTSYHRVVALDAETGAELWAFDPKAYAGPGASLAAGGLHHRGLAFWRNGNESRVFMNTDDRLFSVDAKTGKLVT